MTLTEWLRILMLGPDSDASEETVQQVAAFLQEEDDVTKVTCKQCGKILSEQKGGER